MIIQNLAVTVAVTSVIQFYARLAPDMAQHKPLAKLVSLKLIVGVNFIQDVRFSFSDRSQFLATLLQGLTSFL